MADVAPKEAGLGGYLKAAFTWKWNLLALVGLAGAAALSPAPDIFLPLVGAAEMLYLAGLTAVPNFRRAIDAREHAERRAAIAPVKSEKAQASLDELMEGLALERRGRFAKVKDRCLQMRGLASGVRGSTSGGDDHRMRTPALDKLLWVFLRLLFSQQALHRFLTSTDETEIETKLAEQREKLKKATEDGRERIVASLTDSIATYEMRLDNYKRAESNAEFVAVELDRIEGKIQALTEMSVSNQDPDFISRQVDDVAASMTSTEETIRDLQAITGLAEEHGPAPQILDYEPQLEVEG